MEEEDKEREPLDVISSESSRIQTFRSFNKKGGELNEKSPKHAYIS
jgi:hypothetical protein